MYFRRFVHLGISGDSVTALLVLVVVLSEVMYYLMYEFIYRFYFYRLLKLYCDNVSNSLDFLLNKREKITVVVIGSKYLK